MRDLQRLEQHQPDWDRPADKVARQNKQIERADFSSQSKSALTVLTGVACIALIAAPAFGQAPSAMPAPSGSASPSAAEPNATGTNPAAAAEKGFKRTPAPADAYVYIGWPNDGQVLHTTHIKVWFGTRNFGVAPAGTNKPNTGHHHLLVDVALPPMDQPIPNDKNHLHFGLGQTEAVIDLPPGKHTLQLLMGDADHIPHDPPLMSKKITIYVRVAAETAKEAAAENPVAQTQ